MNQLTTNFKHPPPDPLKIITVKRMAVPPPSLSCWSDKQYLPSYNKQVKQWPGQGFLYYFYICYSPTQCNFIQQKPCWINIIFCWNVNNPQIGTPLQIWPTNKFPMTYIFLSSNQSYIVQINVINGVYTYFDILNRHNQNYYHRFKIKDQDNLTYMN